VQKHQDSPQLRSTRDRRGDARVGAAVRPQDQRLDQAFAGERRGVRGSRRQVEAATRKLLDHLVTTAPPKNREVEAAKAKERSEKRFAAA